MRETYFLYKEGVYGHGVFWIGSDVEDGKRRANKAASIDRDAWHDWALYRFIEPGDSHYDHEPNHEEIYRVNKLTLLEDDKR